MRPWDVAPDGAVATSCHVVGLVLGALMLCACPRVIADEQESTCDTPLGAEACSAVCEDIIAPYREAQPPPAASTDAQCRRHDGEIGCACFAPGAGRPLGDQGDAVSVERGDLFITDSHCGAVGRPGDCLHDPAAFPGCTADTDSGDAVCAIVCADVDDARRDDSDGRQDMTLVRSECTGTCECAISVAGVCTVVFADDERLRDDGVTPLPFTDAAGCP